MEVNIRTLTEIDLDATDDVLKLAFKTSRVFHPQLRRYLALQPGGAFVAEMDGRVVGFGAAIDYGVFSYIGLMAVHPELQHKGIGRMIFERVTAWLQEQKCMTVLLDASPDGAPLYERFGYEDEDSTLVLERREPTSETPDCLSGGVASLSEGDMSRLASFDSPIFGAPRGLLLRSFWNDDPDRFIVTRDQAGEIAGYLVAQPRTLGPWVAAGAVAAERLLVAALDLYEKNWPQVFVSGSNSEALRLLDRFGFKCQRSLRHMRKGTRIQRARRTKIYGQASLGFG